MGDDNIICADGVVWYSFGLVDAPFSIYYGIITTTTTTHIHTHTPNHTFFIHHTYKHTRRPEQILYIEFQHNHSRRTDSYDRQRILTWTECQFLNQRRHNRLLVLGPGQPRDFQPIHMLVYLLLLLMDCCCCCLVVMCGEVYFIHMWDVGMDVCGV